MTKVNWIDSLKGFAIILVVLGHIASPFSRLIYSFHMPIFFIASGFFLNPTNELKSELIKSFKRLFNPFFIYLALGFIVEFLKRFYLDREQLKFDDFTGALIYMDYDRLLGTYAFVLWFLPALFIGRTLVYLILKYSRFFLIEIALTSIAFLIGYNFNFPLAIDDGLISAPYIFIGYYFYKNKGILANKTTMIILLIPLLLISLLYGFPELNISTKYFESILINLIWTCALSFLLFILFSNLKINLKALEYLGINSLIIFLIHPYTNNIAYYAASNYLLQLFISLSMLVLITYFLNNFKKVFKK
ncbi:acyltransferase family protein [Flavobacteriaceae bacterium]|nr:acyltransferase family protein [Flavobacteriaceae bacterium]